MKDLIKMTIKADLKHLGLSLRDGLIFKKGIGYGDLPLNYTERELFLYLRGMSAVYDNRELWRID